MKINLKNVLQLLTTAVRKVSRYRVIIFLVMIAAVYSFVLITINSLSNAQPSTTTVSDKLSAVQPPHVDQTVVNQLQTLRDNSVSVQALFEQARDNPFNE